jgi:hypothetical protein
MKTAIDGEGKILHEGDRVYSYGWEGFSVRHYGTLRLNSDYPDVSEWYIEYDDGNDCAVLDMSMVFKAN